MYVPAAQPYYVKVKIEGEEQPYIEKFHDDIKTLVHEGVWSTVAKEYLQQTAFDLASAFAEHTYRNGYIARDKHTYADEVYFPVHRIHEVHVCKDVHD